MATTDSNLAPEASDTTSHPSQASELPTSTAAAAAASAPPPPASEAPEAPSQPSEPPALAPAPVPGPRASELLRLHDLTLSKTLKTLSYENFAACFPTIARAAPGALRVLWGRIVERLETAGKKNFELILAERDVIRNLNTLDDLVAEAKRRKSRAVVDGEATVPPHLLPPDQILQAHLAPSLASTQSHLNARLQTIQSQNGMLAETLRRQREEIEGLLAALDGRVEDLEGAAAALQDQERGVPALRAAVTEVEVEMSGMEN